MSPFIFVSISPRMGRTASTPWPSAIRQGPVEAALVGVDGTGIAASHDDDIEGESGSYRAG